MYNDYRMVVKMKYLKEIRQKKGLSMQQMANLLKISKTFYWQIETGNRRLSYGMAVKIADIFELRPDDIFLEEWKNNE